MKGGPQLSGRSVLGRPYSACKKKSNLEPLVGSLDRVTVWVALSGPVSRSELDPLGVHIRALYARETATSHRNGELDYNRPPRPGGLITRPYGRLVPSRPTMASQIVTNSHIHTTAESSPTGSVRSKHKKNTPYLYYRPSHANSPRETPRGHTTRTLHVPREAACRLRAAVRVPRHVIRSYVTPIALFAPSIQPGQRSSVYSSELSKIQYLLAHHVSSISAARGCG